MLKGGGGKCWESVYTVVKGGTTSFHSLKKGCGARKVKLYMPPSHFEAPLPVINDQSLRGLPFSTYAPRGGLGGGGGSSLLYIAYYTCTCKKEVGGSR